MNSNDAKTWYNRVILKVNIFSKSSKKQPFSNLFKLIWNLSIDKKVVLMAANKSILQINGALGYQLLLINHNNWNKSLPGLAWRLV